MTDDPKRPPRGDDTPAAMTSDETDCRGPVSVDHTDAATVRAFFARQERAVVSFLGYSGAGYENEAAMLAIAEQVLAPLDPATTLVNIGATAEGIGAVYRLAKARGFVTTGIVSSQARDHGAALSPCVDHVFYIEDATWGGFVDATGPLSPTSTAMVENSDLLVAIGGGAVARDELIAARRQGKATRFFPADMDHRAAIDKARAKGEAIPADFGGAAGAHFGHAQG